MASTLLSRLTIQWLRLCSADCYYSILSSTLVILNPFSIENFVVVVVASVFVNSRIILSPSNLTVGSLSLKSLSILFSAVAHSINKRLYKCVAGINRCLYSSFTELLSSKILVFS